MLTDQLLERLLSLSSLSNVSIAPTHANSLSHLNGFMNKVLTPLLLAAFGFLLSFYTNPWIQQDGYDGAFGAMAGISAAVLALWVPLYFWGRRIRTATLEWTMIRNLIKWDSDREVGE